MKNDANSLIDDKDENENESKRSRTSHQEQQEDYVEYRNPNTVSDQMSEKIRLLLVAKRKDLLSRKYLETDEDECTLVEWISMQESFRLPIDSIGDEFKIKVARTIIQLYGCKILNLMYNEDDSMT